MVVVQQNESRWKNKCKMWRKYNCKIIIIIIKKEYGCLVLVERGGFAFRYSDNKVRTKAKIRKHGSILKIQMENTWGKKIGKIKSLTEKNQEK